MEEINSDRAQALKQGIPKYKDKLHYLYSSEYVS